jgi:hypothetical protein
LASFAAALADPVPFVFRCEVTLPVPKLLCKHGKELCFLAGGFSPKTTSEEELKKMKKTIVRIILVTLLGIAGATPVLADTTPVPGWWKRLSIKALPACAGKVDGGPSL